MLNRLTEILSQTKSISTSGVIYFDHGFSYTYDEDQLLQARTDYREDKKGGEFFSKYRFKIVINEFNDFTKEYKKSITHVTVDDQDLTIHTSIPNVSLTFKWEKDDTTKLKNIIDFFDEISDETTEDNCVHRHTWTKEEVTEFLKGGSGKIFCEVYGDKISFKEDNDIDGDSLLMIAILPKYIGKLLTSTKACTLSIFLTDEDYLYICKFEVQNVSIRTEYFGKTSDYYFSD